MDSRAYSRYPSSSSVSRPVVTKYNLLDKVISDRTEVSQFCTCGNCCMQRTVRESFCCLESGDSLSPYAVNVSKVIGEHRCICDVPRVRAIVLGSEDLELFHQQSVYLKQLGSLCQQYAVSALLHTIGIHEWDAGKMSQVLHDSQAIA
jgi:hypothetical protein|uniref:Uncharacterized protein n=1 Tax=Panagrolaimus sp. PS1159 TaxID=55785 RepID=A0AC35GQW8_9BILA